MKIGNPILIGSIVALVIIAIIIGIVISVRKPKSNIDEYTIFLKKIKKAFLKILILSTDIPDIKDKTIIKVDNIDDLVDISENVRKPIYYIEDNGVCDFILINENQACVYTLKAFDGIVSKLESYLLELEKSKSSNNKNVNLKNIEETTIIEIPDAGLYKVSPLNRKNKKKDNK